MHDEQNIDLTLNLPSLPGHSFNGLQNNSGTVLRFQFRVVLLLHRRLLQFLLHRYLLQQLPPRITLRTVFPPMQSRHRLHRTR